MPLIGGAQARLIVLILPLVWYWYEYVLIKNRHLICYLLMNRSNIYFLLATFCLFN
jgi:hypothetical protein